MSDICNSCTDRGMCCRYIELPLARALTDDEKRWVELHNGLTVKGTNVLRFDINCSALTDAGFCSLYGTADRPAMCDVWPDRPEEQAPVGCAYRASGYETPLEKGLLR